MPILAMHLIGNKTCLSGAIQDHYGPLDLQKNDNVTKITNYTVVLFLYLKKEF